MFRDAAGNSASRRRRRVIFCVRGEQKRALCLDRQIGGRSEVLPTGVTGEADEQAALIAEQMGRDVEFALDEQRLRPADSEVELARHLDASVRTGGWCSYRPPRADEAGWEL